MRLARVLATGAAALPLGACGLTAPPGGTTTITVAPTPGTTTSGAAAQLQDFSDAEKAALRIRNIGCGGVSVGSGFAIGKHLLVTNRHVVGGAAVLQVQTFDGRDIQVTATEATTMADLAVVRTKQALTGAIEMAGSNPDVGDGVTAVGYPLGGQLTTTTGHVLGYGLDPVGWSSLPMLVNDAPIEHGSSGSPLLNADGELVGVVYANQRGRSALCGAG
jgi:S1-C subfamily serine protease